LIPIFGRFYCGQRPNRPKIGQISHWLRSNANEVLAANFGCWPCLIGQINYWPQPNANTAWHQLLQWHRRFLRYYYQKVHSDLAKPVENLFGQIKWVFDSQIES
jgi:hypothetical protein